MDFQSFGSFEEMTAYMAKQEGSANAKLAPEQIALRDDVDNPRYWMRWYPEMRIFIFGHAFSAQQMRDIEKGYYNLSDPGEQAEFEHTMESKADSRRRGYLWGRAYSEIEVEGELGSTHVYNAWPITVEQFEAAKAAGWSRRQISSGAAAALLECLYAWRLHTMSVGDLD